MYQIWTLYHKLCHGNSHTLVIWLESHECLYMIGLFVNEFFWKVCQNLSLSFFLATSTHKRTPCQRISFLNFSSFSLMFFKIGSKSWAHRFIAKTRIFQHHVCLLHRILLGYLKIIFGYIPEQTITHLQFKFELLSGNRL